MSNSVIPVVFTYQWKGRELVDLVKEKKTVFITLEEGSRCEKGAANESVFFSCVRMKNYPNMGHGNINNQDKGMAEEDEIEHSWAVILVSVSFLVLMLLSLGMILFYYLHRIRMLHANDALQRRACKQALKALNNVELKVVEETGEGKECMVCLEMMIKGEEIRCLPCKHKFHRHCIDTWLLSKRKCPLCKLNIVQHFGLVDYEDSDLESDQSDMVPMS